MTTRDYINRRVYTSGLNVLVLLILIGLLDQFLWKRGSVGMVSALTAGAMLGYAVNIYSTQCLNCARELGWSALWWQLGVGVDISPCPHCGTSIDHDLSRVKR
jgi:hypothetical protein